VSAHAGIKVALVYPPSCDPTAPYLSVPTLTAWLRTHGVDVVPIDANLGAWEALLAPEPLVRAAVRVGERLERLEKRRSLSHTDQLAYTALWSARGDALDVPPVIDDALDVMRDRSGARFYDPDAYAGAVATIEAAQRLVSAAHTPLSVDFVSYRTPFSLLDAREIARDAEPDRDPFHDYFVSVAARLRTEGVRLVGVSVAFPGQVQPAFSLAHVLRTELPNAHVTVGGPALTQILLRLEGERLERALGPFHSAVIYEGEHALLEMTRTLERGGDPCAGGRVIRGTTVEDLSVLPPPDFDGLPLERYLAPELVLPYDPSRGCYWGVCTFCHYGLAEVGTARYRERTAATVVRDLDALSRAHGTRMFYFSQDVFAPRIALGIARELRDKGLAIRWGSDMRPERALSPDKCRELAAGGMLSAALGVESASPRVLELIDKGIPAADVASAVRNLSAAGVAVEAMCFTDFPTESYREATETVRFVEDLSDELSLFILGRFDLTHGALVAQKPGEFGIKEVWHVEGDELGTGLFFAEKRKAKRAGEHERLERAVERLSAHWRLRRYPWAGALSTAHTMLWYAHHGKDVFRRLGGATAAVPGAEPRVESARYDVVAVAAQCAEREAVIWHELVHERRRVGRDVYDALASALPHAVPSPGQVRILAGTTPVAASEAPRGRRGSGRRPSHAHNATKS